MRLTISGLPLARHCLHFARPDLDAPRGGDSVYARKGGLFHAMVEHNGAPTEETFPDLPLEDVAEVAAWYHAWTESDLAQHDWTHEQAVAVSPKRGAGVLVRTKDRDYSEVPLDLIPGTVDLYRITAERAIVVDTKTGQQTHTAPAGENAQLRGYALALCRAYGLDAATVIIAHVTADGVFTTEADLDAFDLHAIEQEMAAMLDAAPTAAPQPGMHCRELWCPALAVCPATRQATQLLAPGDPIPVDLAGQPDAVLESVIARVKTIRSLCDHVEESVRSEADARGGIALGDGRVWGRYVDVIEPIAADHPEAPSILARHGVEGAVVTKVSVAKTDLEAAFRDQGKKVAPSMRGLMDELRAVGATRPHEQAKYEARKPKAIKASA